MEGLVGELVENVFPIWRVLAIQRIYCYIRIVFTNIYPDLPVPYIFEIPEINEINYQSINRRVYRILSINSIKGQRDNEESLYLHHQCFKLRKLQQTPGTYPRPSTTC